MALRLVWPRAKPWAVALLLFLLTLQIAGTVAEAAWQVCDNRAYRDEEIEPGGLRLLGVKESPLGDFPEVQAAETHEHFLQQLREVWTDDCPRVMVQLGLQPAAGHLRNWTTAALWLHYFNHSGLVLAVDAVDDYLQHFEDSLRAGPYASLVSVNAADGASGGLLPVKTVRATIAAEGRGAKGKERPVSFEAAGGSKLLAADEVMRACSPGTVGPEAEDEGHPCARILRRMSQPDQLEYFAPVISFDEIWKRELHGKHVDFLEVNIGAAGMLDLLRKGFSKVFQAREVSVMAFRVDNLWTKAELQAVVEWLDKFEYFSVFKLVCADSSQADTFAYRGPGGSQAGPTTYLPISGVEISKVIDWDRMPLPQDVLVLDLRQPDIFRTVQLGDMHCDADETLDETCPQDGSGKCRPSARAGPPGRPADLRVVRSESRSLTIEWRADSDGGAPDTYELRVDPGAMEDSLEEDVYDAASGAQMHTIGSLQPSTKYTVRLRASNAAGASEESKVVHRTEAEKAAAAVGAMYDLAEHLHCGMSSAEEVTPPGPPPSGGSFFREVTDAEGCRAKCDDSRQCVTFQVKIGDACWLYRRRPTESRLAAPRGDDGWWCGVRKRDP